MYEEQPPNEYTSYNGMGRNPMVWGIPYMPGLFTMVFSLLGGMLLGVFVSPFGWLFALIGVPIALYFKMLCATDDKAIDILVLELKWTLIKMMGGNAKYYGGTMTIAPTSYGRKMKHVKRYFETTISG